MTISAEGLLFSGLRPLCICYSDCSKQDIRPRRVANLKIKYFSLLGFRSTVRRSQWHFRPPALIRSVIASILFWVLKADTRTHSSVQRMIALLWACIKQQALVCAEVLYTRFGIFNLIPRIIAFRDGQLAKAATSRQALVCASKRKRASRLAVTAGLFLSAN